ncbi:hypothetical protein BACCAP_01074 [Pseudoflavonifractor capillosus ATCC 29799]|uniref:Uncharacterized protein n=1 Tax=Pseudoflavonifractor capillosus ATCC 29799 TaxID=411467 RepID=A6NS95_9FIRM|nr:hypothetical protein BACCAP_01074 [Pseudoflavonifractor capillosus ATCC 29799]
MPKIKIDLKNVKSHALMLDLMKFRSSLRRATIFLCPFAPVKITKSGV